MFYLDIDEGIMYEMSSLDESGLHVFVGQNLQMPVHNGASPGGGPEEVDHTAL